MFRNIAMFKSRKNNSKCKYITILFKTILPGVLLFVKKHNLTPVSQIDVQCNMVFNLVEQLKSINVSTVMQWCCYM